MLPSAAENSPFKNSLLFTPVQEKFAKNYSTPAVIGNYLSFCKN